MRLLVRLVILLRLVLLLGLILWLLILLWLVLLLLLLHLLLRNRLLIGLLIRSLIPLWWTIVLNLHRLIPLITAFQHSIDLRVILIKFCKLNRVRSVFIDQFKSISDLFLRNIDGIIADLLHKYRKFIQIEASFFLVEVIEYLPQCEVVLIDDFV